MEGITYIVLGWLATTSIVLAWFNTTLPIHVCETLMKLRLGCKEFWTQGSGITAVTPELWSTVDFENFAHSRLKKFKLLGFGLSDLLTCPICFSFHVSFWVFLAIGLTTNITYLAWFLTSPIVCQLLLSYVSANKRH